MPCRNVWRTRSKTQIFEISNGFLILKSAQIRLSTPGGTVSDEWTVDQVDFYHTYMYIHVRVRIHVLRSTCTYLYNNVVCWHYEKVETKMCSETVIFPQFCFFVSGQKLSEPLRTCIVWVTWTLWTGQKCRTFMKYSITALLLALRTMAGHGENYVILLKNKWGELWKPWSDMKEPRCELGCPQMVLNGTGRWRSRSIGEHSWLYRKERPTRFRTAVDRWINDCHRTVLWSQYIVSTNESRGESFGNYLVDKCLENGWHSLNLGRVHFSAGRSYDAVHVDSRR